MTCASDSRVCERPLNGTDESKAHDETERNLGRKGSTGADAHHRRTGRWPRLHDGPVLDAPGETWLAVDSALAHGARGLPGGTTLALFMQAHRGVRHVHNQPALTVEEILARADAYLRRTGRWPTNKSGRIPDTNDTWGSVDDSLRKGCRGLAPGSSLARLLADRRGRPIRSALHTVTGRFAGLPGGKTLAAVLQTHRQVRTSRHGRPP
jgi:hypothetical protein